MAAPTYTTDLTTIVDFDNDSPTVLEPTGWLAGRSPVNDDEDFPIQSVTHGSLTMNTTGKSGIVATGPTRTWTSGDYLFGWIIWLAPAAITTQANGGLVMIAGSSDSVQKIWYVGGKEFGLYPYGGWQNFAVDPEIAGDESNGTATDFYVVGGGANVLTKVSKGNPLGIDVFRYGRGEIRVAAGEAANYANFTGMASTNDVTTARWGLFQAIESGFKFKGLMTLGYGALVNFVDSNKNIIIDNTEFVQSDFNPIEVRNASSVVDWTSITIQSLSTLSPGTFEVIDNATVDLTACTFIDMSTFGFLSNSTVSSAFSGCDQITHGGSNMSDSSIVGYEGTAGTAALVYDIAVDPNGEVDNMTFEKGTAATHAMELGTNTPSEITLTGWDTTGYNAAHGNNDSTIYNNSGKAITIYVVGGTGNFTYRNGTSATTTIVVDPVTTEITVLDDEGTELENARVFLEASDNTGDLPYKEIVTITRSGTVATVSHAAHGFVTGNIVVIRDAVQDDYNKAATVTYIDDGSYSYIVTESPDTPATGTITATGAIFNTLTNALGIATDSRTFTQEQPITGWARMSSSEGSLFKTGKIVGTISNTTGYSTTVQLVSDE